ncbi:hypothetical protein MRX96_014633 [Rhipicephalus microplus]
MPGCLGVAQTRLRLLRLLFLASWTCMAAHAMCPSRCVCDDENLRVSGVSSFSVYGNLRYLDVSHNQLVSLGKENFHSHKYLVVLVLARNMISQLDNTTFKGLDELQTLLLNENYIDSIPAGVFAPLKKLEKLDLSQNRLVRVTEQAFQGLTKLKTLLLRDNKFVTIPSQAFAPLSFLLNLDLGLNMFSNIPEEAFVALKQLEELSLRWLWCKDGAERRVSTALSLAPAEAARQRARRSAHCNIPGYNTAGSSQLGTEQVPEASTAGLRVPQVLENSGMTATPRNSPLTPETALIRCGGGPPAVKDKLLRDIGSADLGCYDAVLRRQIIIGVVAAAAILFALIVALGFRFRERVAGVLKNKWGNGTKEPQYHKTHGEDDNSMCQVAHQPLKLIPVTEL